MYSPLVSVIIPTHARPQYLPRALSSALEYSGNSVEIIVVPNGSDESWQTSLAPWAGDPRVRVSPIATAHGNVARNHGMMLARGKYIRFLDDDDYLLPHAAHQVSMIVEEDADVCSGLVVSIDRNGDRLGRTSFPATEDFTVAALSLTGFALPTCHIFRRAAVVDCRWDEELPTLQDRGWLISLVGLREFAWVRAECEVGVWFQHEASRTSEATASRGKHSIIIRKLYTLPRLLAAQSRATEERLSAISAALWDYVHRGFPYYPAYWTGVARSAMALDGRQRVNHPFYAVMSLGPRTALFWEWIFVPLRRLKKLFSAMNTSKSGNGYRRTV